MTLYSQNSRNICTCLSLKWELVGFIYFDVEMCKKEKKNTKRTEQKQNNKKICCISLISIKFKKK